MSGEQAQGNGTRNALWMLLLIVGAWLPAINQLRFEWSMNAHYTYGWFVPFLALYLGLERWKTRSAPASSKHPRLALSIICVSALSLFPLRLIQEANPDWRLLSWALAIVAIIVSFSVLELAGGATWRTYFAFPAAFMVIAVPWPVFWEQTIVQGLMRAVVAITVEALGWCGIPAVQQGNVIAISTGQVGVEEACSGVRSLQTALMISLFLGELFRLSTWRRIGMLGGAVIIAFLLNVARSFVLVWLCASRGQDYLEKIHDTVGTIFLVVTLAALAALAFLFRGKKPGDAPEDDNAAVASHLPIARFSRTGTALFVWLVLVEGATEGWYRLHERNKPVQKSWSVEWPTGQAAFRETPISERTKSLLLYDDARSATWSEPDRTDWTMIFIRWQPGRVSTQRAYSHAPEYCLSSHGAALVAEIGLQPMNINGLELPLRAYLFNSKGRHLYVYYCIWDMDTRDQGPKSAWRRTTQLERLKSVAQGRRNPGQLLLEIGVAGVADKEQARTAVESMLQRVVRP